MQLITSTPARWADVRNGCEMSRQHHLIKIKIKSTLHALCVKFMDVCFGSFDFLLYRMSVRSTYTSTFHFLTYTYTHHPIMTTWRPPMYDPRIHFLGINLSRHFARIVSLSDVSLRYSDEFFPIWENIEFSWSSTSSGLFYQRSPATPPNYK